MDYSTEQLHIINQGLKQGRAVARDIAKIRLSIVWGPAEKIARQLNDYEARLLLFAAERIPHMDLEQLDVTYDPCQHEEDERLIPPANFACTLAGQLQLLCLVSRDSWFPAPVDSEQLEQVDRLIDSLQTYTPAESVALHVLLDIAKIVHVGTLFYNQWWHPPMLLRLLINPELDRQVHHV